ncbi:MAG: anhydro-N-acetylmuramic acid kinase [Sphingomonadales bacterium]
MEYRSIGLMSGSSLDGLDMAYVTFLEQGGQWSFTLGAAECVPYSTEWIDRLRSATELSARDYCLLHADYGRWLGEQVNAFVDRHQLHYKIAVVGSHGHTTFHMPNRHMTGQLGDGASLAALTGLSVVTELRAMDVALGGQGAPIVPIGEKYLFTGTDFFLNIGGIANISYAGDPYVAFDICAANRVLNMIAALNGLEYDKGGALAAAGRVDQVLLKKLEELAYYQLPYPKSLANDFGTDVVFPLVQASGLSVSDMLATYTRHIVLQITSAVQQLAETHMGDKGAALRLLATGGGACNDFLIAQLRESLAPLGVGVEVPSLDIVQYKEALIMAFMAVLRWRQEYTVLSSVTGASRDSIGGALWTGQEA